MITASAFAEHFLCKKQAEVIKNEVPINYIILSHMQDARGTCNTNLMNCNVMSFIDFRLLLLLCYVYGFVRMYSSMKSRAAVGESNWKLAAIMVSENKISLSLSLSHADQFCRFSKLRVSLVSSETDAGSPQGRSDTHQLSPSQKATGNKTEEFT